MWFLKVFTSPHLEMYLIKWRAKHVFFFSALTRWSTVWVLSQGRCHPVLPVPPSGNKCHYTGTVSSEAKFKIIYSMSIFSDILQWTSSQEWCFFGHWLACCPLTAGPQTDQGGAAALQGGGGDAEGASAPKHCPLLWLLGVCAPRQKVHCARHRTNDFRDSQNVRTVWCKCIYCVWSPD